MARIITVTSGKGGVGKSSVCANLGTALANNGHSVCMIDADLGLRNLDIILGLEGRIVYDLEDVIHGTATLSQALVRDKRVECLSILPACKNLDVRDVSLTYMQSIINELQGQFEFILIDSPAGIENGFLNAIYNANEAIVVVNLDISSIRDADKVIGLLNSKGIKDVKLIVNKVDPNLIENDNSLTVDDALEILAIPLLGIVYYDEFLIGGNNKGIPIYYNSRSLASQCFKNIARRLNGENVELVKFKRKSLFSRIFS
jgi:septum site-determining protein MinD